MMNRYKVFYKELGKLLYSIAKADGTIQIKEMETIRQIVKDELVPLEDSVDEFGSDAAFYTEFEVEALEEMDIHVENVFFDFIKFMRETQYGKNERIKQMCIRSIERVAEAYKGVTKVEQHMVDVLKAELAKIPN